MIAQNTQLTTTHLCEVTASAAGIGAAAGQLAQADGQQQGAIVPPNQVEDAAAKEWEKAHGQEEWAALVPSTAPEVPSNFIPSLMNFAIQVRETPCRPGRWADLSL